MHSNYRDLARGKPGEHILTLSTELIHTLPERNSIILYVIVFIGFYRLHCRTESTRYAALEYTNLWITCTYLMSFLCNFGAPFLTPMDGYAAHQQLIPARPQDFQTCISLANNSLPLFSTDLPSASDRSAPAIFGDFEASTRPARRAYSLCVRNIPAGTGTSRVYLSPSSSLESGPLSG